MLKSINQTNLKSEKTNRSFASQKLALLQPLNFNFPVPSQPSLIFLHPPKTGGTNLCFITEALSKIKPEFKQHRFSVPRLKGQSPNKMVDNWQGGLESAEEALRQNPNFCDSINFMSGHFPFGLHQLINVPARYIALIRNPIERELSSANFDYQRGFINQGQAEEYLLQENIDNPQTRLLAGQDFMVGTCNELTLAKAQENIEKHFLLAGVTEDTNTFIQILASIQGWGPIALCRAQVTGDKVFVQPSTEFKQRLLDKHQFDIKLYNWVKSRWANWKENYVKSPKVETLEQAKEKILCITEDFTHTRIPLLLTKYEIGLYNEQVSDDLIELTQATLGLKAKDTSNSIPTNFFMPGYRNKDNSHVNSLLLSDLDVDEKKK